MQLVTAFELPRQRMLGEYVGMNSGRSLFLDFDWWMLTRPIPGRNIAGYTVIAVENALYDVRHVGMLAGSRRDFGGLAMNDDNVGEDASGLLFADYFQLGQREQKRFTDAQRGRSVSVN
jgi:hypothetical protein